MRQGVSIDWPTSIEMKAIFIVMQFRPFNPAELLNYNFYYIDAASNCYCVTISSRYILQEKIIDLSGGGKQFKLN